MKKIIKKIIIILTIVLMISTYLFPILAFEEFENKKYVALGDSIAYGYGLQNKDVDSYAAKLKENYKIADNNFENLAVSGMTCAEFYQLIQTENYKNKIKDANLLTISIGSNELLRIVNNIASTVSGVSQNEPDFAQKVQEAFMGANLLKKGQMLKQAYDIFTSEENKRNIEAAIKSYKENWSNSINYIKEINSNVIIVATEFYNPYYECSLSSYDLGGYVDEYIQMFNQILTEDSNNESNYKIAKIYNVFNTTNPRVTNVNLSLSNFNVDPHPNISGHELIYAKIVDALSSVESKKINIGTLQIEEIKDQIYTGQAITPEVVINSNDKTLLKNKDYTVSYVNNINVGEAQILITGIGNYEGQVVKTFNIKEETKKNISQLRIADVANQVYTGISIEPNIEIFDGNDKLLKNTDYELGYMNNINVGVGSIYVRGIGNYSGNKEIKFNITPKDIALVAIQDLEDQIYSGKAIQPVVIITDGSAKLVENKDYNISYSNNENVGVATITIQGINNYTGTTTTKFNIVNSTETKLKDLADLEISDIVNKVYTGKLITPEVRIKDGNIVLEKNIDYTISYINNINIGTGTTIITGIGNYSGKVEKSFKIVRKNIENTLILDIKAQNYTGKEIKPDVEIYNDKIKLKENVDYTITYKDNIEEGKAIIEITGIGNYTGVTTKTFNIVKEESKVPEVNNKDEKVPQEDNTIANQKLPYAGGKMIIIVTIFVMIVISVISYILYKKYNL